jgi:hypothetical protein
MPIYLPAEYETEVAGTGDGFVSFTQKRRDGEEMVMFLSLHQFETIFNHEKTIVREALNSDVSQ